MKEGCTGASLLCILALTACLGVHGQDGRPIVTTMRSEAHAEATAYANGTSSSVTASGNSTTITIDVARGEAEEEGPKKPNADIVPETKQRGHGQFPRLSSHGEERNATERVRRAIVNADVERLASLLMRINETDLLGLGFTFPADRSDAHLIFTQNRIKDPDVVALKGMALAALEGDQAKKLTEIFIAAVYGLDFGENVCLDFTNYRHSRTVTKNRTVTKSGYRKITNESGTFVVDSNNEFKNQVSQDDLVEEINVEYEDAEGSLAAEDVEDYKCYTKEEIKTIRKKLRRDFNDIELMTSIVEGNPRRVSHRQRSLLTVGVPIHTWLCGSCWKKSFCNKNVEWCPQ